MIYKVIMVPYMIQVGKKKVKLEASLKNIEKNKMLT